MNKVAVCILNFNGTADTIACLESILKYDSSFPGDILILDNGSAQDNRDNLVEALRELFSEQFTFFNVGNNEFIEKSGLDIRTHCSLFLSDINMGFAKGNNLLVKIAINSGYSAVLLMNNDTELLSNSISALFQAAMLDEKCSAASVDIRYYDNHEKSWNAGGNLFFGTRRYIHEDEVKWHLSRGTKWLHVSYLTGCFLLIKASTVDKIGLLSERFFFGEEDYEYALRLKHNGMKSMVLLDHQILHKVGSSVSKINETNVSRGFIHHLNRAIDMRAHYPYLLWLLWFRLSMHYWKVQLIESGVANRREAHSYVTRLNFAAKQLDAVPKDVFEYYIKKPNSYFFEG